MSAEQVTHSLLSHAAALAVEIGAGAVFLYADAVPSDDWEIPAGLQDRLTLVCRTDEELEQLASRGFEKTIRVPRHLLTRMGQVKVAVLIALTRGMLASGDSIVCLAGIARSGSLDMLLVTEVGKEFEVFLAPSAGEAIVPYMHPEVLGKVIEIAVALGSEGREGKPVGTLFVVGDSEKVVPLTHQMILNPFYGYQEEERNILDDKLFETIKELATVDGAFIIRGDGVVHSSGTYLKTSSFPEESLPAGLGARHQAAAGISFATECIAVAVSQSTGTVTVFRNGRIVTALEKPPSVGTPSSP